MKPLPCAMVVACSLLAGEASAQYLVQTAYYAPVPVAVAPAPVVVYRPVLQPFTTVVAAPAPVAVTAYMPALPAPSLVAAPIYAAAPVAVPVTTYSPAAVTVTRRRPILGGTVSRTRVGYAPVTTYYVP